MISVTRPGGFGFFAMTYQGQRLAYLREDPDEQIVITSKDPIPGPSRYIFYELWNAPLWDKLAGSTSTNFIAPTMPASFPPSHMAPMSTDVLKGLQNAIDRGDISLTRVIKDPAGNMRSYNYDLKGCLIQEMIEEVKVNVGGGIILSRRIRFSPPPRQTYIAVNPPSLTPAAIFQKEEVKKEDEPLDLSAPVYALRSFHLNSGRLKSLYRDFYWDEGKAIAECGHDHEIPSSGCSCGLYGLQSLDRLVREYGKECQRCVGVFAAEGRTIIGDRGLKTKAARIVAYWVQTGTELAVMQNQVPKAKHFEDMAEMLAEYHFPAWGTVEPGGGEKEYWGYESPSPAERWKFDPAEREPQLDFADPDAWARRKRSRPTPPATYTATSTDPGKIVAMMGSAATPGGIAAVHYAMGLIAPVGPGTSSPKVTDYAAKKGTKKP